MGNEISLVNPRDECEPKMCGCKTGRATYRCRINTDKFPFQPLKGFPSRQKEILEDETLSSSLRRFPFLMQSYLESTKKPHSLRYIACDNCIIPDFVYVFTHLPGGWMECDHIQQEYEEAQPFYS